MKPLPPLEYLKTLFDVDLTTGKVTWLVRRPSYAGKAQPGAEAGWMLKVGYRYLTIDQQDIGAHRVVWLFGTGNWPRGHIDHINGNRGDNRFCNLREATQAENNQNHHGQRSNNTSGVKGVVFDKRRQKWLAQISANRKHYHLGRFDTIEQATEAIRAGRAKYHPTAHEAATV